MLFCGAVTHLSSKGWKSPSLPDRREVQHKAEGGKDAVLPARNRGNKPSNLKKILQRFFPPILSLLGSHCLVTTVYGWPDICECQSTRCPQLPEMSTDTA